MDDAAILIAEDDPQVRQALERILVFEGYQVTAVADGAAALAEIAAGAPDLIVLDVMMPVIDGFAVCRRLRARGDLTPVLMLTARDEVSDRVEGLDSGADDYLAKPFALDELLARVRALLRRGAGGRPADDPVLRFADLELDVAGRLARRNGRPIELTPTEFRILDLLIRKPGVVIDRATMYTEIWGYQGATSSKSLDVHTRLVRRKLEAGGESRLVHTVHGVGYVLREALVSEPSVSEP